MIKLLLLKNDRKLSLRFQNRKNYFWINKYLILKKKKWRLIVKKTGRVAKKNEGPKTFHEKKTGETGVEVNKIKP